MPVSANAGVIRNGRLRKAATPYMYILPTVILLLILLVIPIVMVIAYSLFDNVIIANHTPAFVWFQNYVTVLTDSTFHKAIWNTLYFVLVSIVAHIILGMTFAMILNTHYLSTRVKGIFRVYMPSRGCSQPRSSPSYGV